MSNPLVSENVFLLYSIYMGIFITFVYDLLRIFRRVISHNGFFVSLEDFFFWVYCALGVFWMMHSQSNGNLRWFAIFGALFGMIAYKKLISKWFVNLTAKVLRKLFHLLGKPFGFLGRGVRKLLRSAKLRMGRVARFLKKKLTERAKLLRMKLWKQRSRGKKNGKTKSSVSQKTSK